jgi:hypothetical protein
MCPGLRVLVGRYLKNKNENEYPKNRLTCKKTKDEFKLKVRY